MNKAKFFQYRDIDFACGLAEMKFELFEDDWQAKNLGM